MGAVIQLCLLALGLQAATAAKQPAPHSAGMDWALRTASQWSSTGIPARVSSPATSATMLNAAAMAIWGVAHTIDRDSRFVELFSGASGTTSAYIR
eukprot:4183216-Pyramimonas_sp.AAC.1